jgi:hypothetical protein
VKRRHGYSNVAYAAEARATDRCWRGKGEPVLVPVEARRFAEHVIQTEGWEPVEVRFYSGRTGGGWAFDKDRRISLSNRGPTRSLVLHELAHVATPGDRGHGKQFRSEFLRLARRYMPAFARSLAAAYVWFGASFNENRETL